MKIIFIMVPQCIYLYTWKEVVLVVDSVWGARTRGDPLATSPSMGEREGLFFFFFFFFYENLCKLQRIHK